MKRIAVNFGATIMAFAFGVGCELAFNRYLDANSPKVPPSMPAHTQIIDLATPLPEEQGNMTPPPPGSLGVELERIDRIYRKRCQLPTDWYGDWLTVKQLATFRTCNERWAIARHEAINEELRNYLIQY